MKASRKVLLLASVASVTIAASAHAQDAIPTGQPAPASGPQGPGAPLNSAQSDGDIVVTGTRASLENAERLKRDADVVVDAISGDDIGVLPDINIADSLVRIAGVSSEDSASIRGLGADLTLIQYNGRIIPSSEQNTRRVQLVSLPTEGVARAAVQKTNDASTIEGGVGGVLNLESIHPLETKRRGLDLVVRGVRNSVAARYDLPELSDFTGRAEVTYVGELAPNLGISFSYAYFKQANASTQVDVDGWRLGTVTRADLNADGVPDALPTSVGAQIGTNTAERHAVVSMVQWDVTPSLRLSVDGIYNNNFFTNNPRRFVGQGVFNGSNGATIGTPTVNEFNGVTALDAPVALYRTTSNEFRARDKTVQGGVNFAFDDGGSIKAKLDVSYGVATRQRRIVGYVIENDAANATAQRLPFSYDISDRDNPQLLFRELPPEDFALASLSNDLQDVKESIAALRNDYSYVPEESTWIQSVAWGIRLERRAHDTVVTNEEYTYRNAAGVVTVGLRPDLDSSFLLVPTNPLVRTPGAVGGVTGANWPIFDLDKIFALNTAPNAFFDPEIANANANFIDVTEDTAALYYQVNMRPIDRLRVNVGLRYFLTDATIIGRIGTTAANTRETRNKSSYSYMLPALNIRYDLTRTLLTRFGFSKGVARPPFQALRTGASVDLTQLGAGGTVTYTAGNPDLEPFTALNYDLTLEWYPRRTTSAAIQLFNKDVDNFIVTPGRITSTTVTLPDGTSIPANITQPFNDPDARRFYGFELLLRQQFDFLPGPLSNLGVQGNYTRTFTDSTDVLPSLVNPAPLPNQVTVTPVNFAKHLANAQIFYSSRTLDLRAAYRYQSRTAVAGAVNGYRAPVNMLDITAGYNIRRSLRVFGSLTNVLGNRRREYRADYRNEANDTLTTAYFAPGSTLNVGLRAHF